MGLPQSANKGYWRHFVVFRVTFVPAPRVYSRWTCIWFASKETFSTFNKLLI